MATYVNDLRLKEIATGDESGTWGTSTNTNLELIGEALGFGTEAITTNADTHTTTVADGSTDPGRAMYLKYTGTLDSACTITIAPNTISRMHFIENGTSGSQNIIISQGSGANVTIPAGDVKAVYLDGAGSGAAVTDAFASLNVVDLKVEDDLTVTDDLIVNGDIDLEGSIDVNGTANLDVVDIDGAVDMASTLQVDGAITSSAGATITVADNSDNLTLTSTDADANAGPNLRLYRNSGSPADNDGIGDIQYEGRNDNSQDVIYASLAGFIDDASDGTEDGILHINSMVAGTLVNRMSVIPAATVFNEGSVDVDFRVESDGEANMLFVDAGNNVVTVGGATFETADTFCVREAGANSVNTRLVNTNDDANGVHLVLEKSSSSPGDNDELGQISFFGRDDAGNANTFAAIRVFADDVSNASEDGIITFSTIKAGTFTEHMRIQPDGSVGIGTTSPDFTNGSGLEIERAGIATLRLKDTGSGGKAFEIFADDGTGYQIAGLGSGMPMMFQTVSTERMRILSTGLVAIGTTVNTVARMHIQESESRDCLRLTNTRNPSSSAPFVATFGFNFQPNNGTSTFLACQDDLDGSPTNRCVISSNGGIANYQSNNSNLSDARLKTNIQDAPNALDIINNLKVRTFKYHDQTDEKIHTGLIAQETETVDLSLVNQDGWADKAPEGEEPYKSIYNTDLMFKMLKAIQEQQEQIEQLKTQIKTLQ